MHYRVAQVILTSPEQRGGIKPIEPLSRYTKIYGSVYILPNSNGKFNDSDCKRIQRAEKQKNEKSKKIEKNAVQ
jgi:hypothetical protein